MVLISWRRCGLKQHHNMAKIRAKFVLPGRKRNPALVDGEASA